MSGETYPVPDLVGLHVHDAERVWAEAGFTSEVQTTRPGNFRIGSQSVEAGTAAPADVEIAVTPAR